MDALLGPVGDALRKEPLAGVVLVPVVPVDACKCVVPVSPAGSKVAGCVCGGRLEALSVNVAEPVPITVLLLVPAFSPCAMGVNPGPGACDPTGALPRKSGRPKVFTPSPPYVVPSKANMAEFC